MHNARIGTGLGEYLSLTGLIGLTQVSEEKGMVAGFDAEDEVSVGIAEVAQMGSVAAECVLNDDDLQERMILTKVLQPTAGRVAFTVVFDKAILLDDRFGCQRDNFFEVGMDQGCAEQLVGIGDMAPAMVLDHARSTMDFLGREVACAIKCQEVAAVEEDVILQDFASLEAAKDFVEQRPQCVGFDGIENGSHLGIGWNTVDCVDGAEVVVGITPPPIEDEQGRVFEREHGKSGHQGVSQRDRGPIPNIRDLIETRTESPEESVG